MSNNSSGVVVRRLQELLDGLVARNDITHAIVAVERGDRSFRWIGTAGDANPDGTPMRQETPFFIASIDKMYTAAVVLQLHEAGVARLDESITAYLPPALVGELHRLGGVDHTDRITVRHLLGHTSGLADHLEDAPKGGKSLFERLMDEGDFTWDRQDALRTVREQLAPHFPPQAPDARHQKVRYSNTNYLLLAAIIEAVTRAPLHVAWTERIFKRLKPAAHVRAGRDLDAGPHAVARDAVGRRDTARAPPGAARPVKHLQHGR